MTRMSSSVPAQKRENKVNSFTETFETSSVDFVEGVLVRMCQKTGYLNKRELALNNFAWDYAASNVKFIAKLFPLSSSLSAR